MIMKHKSRSCVSNLAGKFKTLTMTAPAIITKLSAILFPDSLPVWGFNHFRSQWAPDHFEVMSFYKAYVLNLHVFNGISEEDSF